MSKETEWIYKVQRHKEASLASTEDINHVWEVLLELPPDLAIPMSRALIIATSPPLKSESHAVVDVNERFYCEGHKKFREKFGPLVKQLYEEHWE